MNRLSLIVFCLLSSICFAQDKTSDSLGRSENKIENPNYNAELAKKNNADDYGMKAYFLVIFKTGNNKTTDKKFINQTFVEHMENINRLVKEKKLVVSGPFGNNDAQMRGLFILQNIDNINDAKKLLQTDLAVKNGLLIAEIYPWYGSAALQEYLPISDKIWKKNP